VAGTGALALCSAPRISVEQANDPSRLVVNLNTAPPAVLAALPRLGPSLVNRIVTARERAPFRSLDDLDARVQGIGPATIVALKPFLRIDTIEP